MAKRFLYRKNGGEVLRATIDDTVWSGIDSTYYGIVSDPTAPDGEDLVPTKIFDAGSIRNATQPEIDSFPTHKDTDDNLIQRTAADTRLDSGISDAKLIKALAAVVMDEINILRAQHGLADRNLAQLKTAIKNKLATGDAD